MAKKTFARRGLRTSRPDAEQFLTVMFVFAHRTFRWSLERRILMRILATVGVIWVVAMTGSAYGLWATKKLMSFSSLQRETYAQKEQLKETLNQAHALDGELQTLRQQMSDLLRLLDPKNPAPALPPSPGSTPPPPADSRKVSELRGQLERASAQAHLLRARMDPIIDRWNHTPSIPPTAGYLSSGFGIRLSPFSRANEEGDSLLGYHSGFDITNAEGTPIQATADGEVVEAGWMDRYGNGVVLAHTDRVETLYAHMSRLRVKTGQKVSRGDILGYMGRTGKATGVHLHYEVRLNGRPVNPQPYMRLQREWLKGLR
ncbi:M23 family metallopeptidase [Mesoterricola sediminis]|uniref:Peptidase M24 n=1 Tax=Mesoterricola sediminis TaxID=2927980 RepID=A0AA48H7W3_9BACT|nr:M23 family metallopeptidase [Mesoterricola sediminis]BDU77563.1 peptidase M24 [Mesoterricola sediminis]